MEAKKSNNDKKQKTTYLLIGLGVVALTGAAATYYILNKNKTSSNSDLDFLTQAGSGQLTLPELPKPRITSDSSSSSSSSKTGFPLKRGSRGRMVKQLQEMLIKKYGKSILPKWGADGAWGSELDNALRSKKLPTLISESLFKRYAQLGSAAFSPSGVKKVAQVNGLPKSNRLMTIKKSKIWNGKGNLIIVKSNTLLGTLINETAGITQFKTLDHKRLFVNSNNITHIV